MSLFTNGVGRLLVKIRTSCAFHSPTWKEEKKRSMKSLVRRRAMVVLVDSSVTKMKTT